MRDRRIVYFSCKIFFIGGAGVGSRTVLAEIKECFEKFQIGKEFDTKDIKQMVNDAFGTNPNSVIPSDCCYNITNNGIKNYRDYLHIFEQLARGRYKYLGPNYKYSGPVLNKGTVVGKWEDGLYSDI